ncbi:carbohydrate-binding domain-containing protein [Roseburia inulinivorans]|uniref:Carbohydrate-binding domain-containing protein n=1 Tax=Roseburia inulinivorans TaxID=360807 RepID=A0A3R5YYL9_9FIRM|nr:carbohydrate-binding domain-containing protein [Roseburia inulinivorans]RGQ49543.1 carbohydrate-binding domain-containing protein [Roseburia inulinivorans]
MKKLNKWIAGLLCMMLVMTMVAGLGVTEVKADDAVITVSSWTELKNAIRNDGNIQLGNDIVAETGDYSFNVNKNVTIDLNGYKIDRNLNEQQDNVFSVIAGGTLIIKDTSEGQNGKITGGWANEDYAGGINVREGTLILESGNIVGNRSNKTFTKRGGGVAVFYNGTFIMRGGKISGNEAGYGAGVVVLDNCNFEMTGGEITDNICDFGEYQDQEGAGVFAYQGADVTIGGSANIYGNKNSKDENSNLYIYRYKSSEKINLSTTVPLTTGAKIGVGYYQPYGKNEIPLADSGKQFKDAFFTDDDKNYEITTKDGVDGIFYSPKNSSGGSSTPSTPTSYKLRVGGVEVTSANTSGTGWSYDNQTNTLTLDGFNYEGNGSGIETSKDLNIIIKNENRIKNISSSYSDSTNGWSCGIYAFGNLTITGDGTLDVTGGTADTSHGISVLGKLEIDSQGTIIAKAQATAGTSGIYAYDGIVIKNGNITAYAAEAAYSSRGIECDGDITISGGTVVAKAEKGEISSYGLESGKKITISPNAVVTASGVTAALNKKPEGYTGEIGTTFVSNNTNPNPTPTPEPTPAPEPTPTPSEPSTTQGESTTTSTPASTSTASTQGSQQVIPTIIEGAGSSYTQGSGNTIYFRSSDSFANFQKVMVDNAELSADCYTATEGSIIITLKPEYLSTLAAGTHSISIVSANGVATADFEVQTADTTAVSPKTGDNDQAALWITLLLLSCGALTAVGIRKKVR